MTSQKNETSGTNTDLHFAETGPAGKKKYTFSKKENTRQIT